MRIQELITHLKTYQRHWGDLEVVIALPNSRLITIGSYALNSTKLVEEPDGDVLELGT